MDIVFKLKQKDLIDFKIQNDFVFLIYKNQVKVAYFRNTGLIQDFLNLLEINVFSS